MPEHGMRANHWAERSVYWDESTTRGELMKWFWRREKSPKPTPAIPVGAVRRKLRYTGSVQAVGFRFTAQCWAEQCGVTGWVTNLIGGDVMLEVQGTSEQVAAFMAQVDAESARKGAFIHAQLIESTPLDPIPEDSFVIRNLY